jgi:hypothetical protein
MERLLETNASALAFTGLALGITHSKKWLIIPGIVLPFLFQHALQGWCPPVPVFRRLSSSVDGVIKQIRFWRAAEEPPGGHTAKLWTASGTLLKTATFFGETSGPGWQYATVNFPITAGVRYRVSYNINCVVAKTFNVFNNGPITEGPLTAWASYYSTPAGSFPTTYSTSNLFADVVFNSPR